MLVGCRMILSVLYVNLQLDIWKISKTWIIDFVQQLFSLWTIWTFVLLLPGPKRYLFKSSPHPMPCLVSNWVSQSLLLLRLDWCDPGLWRITQSLQKSRNLFLPYQLLSVLTSMLLTLEQNKSIVVDAGTKQKPWCHKSDLANFSPISDHFKKKFVFVKTVYASARFVFGNDFFYKKCSFLKGVVLLVSFSWPAPNVDLIWIECPWNFGD